MGLGLIINNPDNVFIKISSICISQHTLNLTNHGIH